MRYAICVMRTGRRWRRIYPPSVSYTQTSQVSRCVCIGEIDRVKTHRLMVYSGYGEEQGSSVYCMRHPSTPSGGGNSAYRGILTLRLESSGHLWMCRRLSSTLLYPSFSRLCNPQHELVYRAFEWFLLAHPSQIPDEARAIAIQQLQTIAGVARGLTRTNDSLLIFDEAPEVQQETERMRRAREDPRMIRLRDGILDGIRRTVELWSIDASISNVRVSAKTLYRKGSEFIFSGLERTIQGYNVTTNRCHPLVFASGTASRTPVFSVTETVDCCLVVSGDNAYHPAQPAKSTTDDFQTRPRSGSRSHRAERPTIVAVNIPRILQPIWRHGGGA